MCNLPALFIETDGKQRCDDHETGKRGQQQISKVQTENAGRDRNGDEKNRKAVGQAETGPHDEVRPSGTQPLHWYCQMQIALPPEIAG